MPLPRLLARINRRVLNPREIARGEADAALGRTGRRRSKPGSEHLRLDIAG